MEILFRHCQHISTKVSELVTQEPAMGMVDNYNPEDEDIDKNLHVGEVDLVENVEQIEKLTEKEFHEVSSTSGGTEYL